MCSMACGVWHGVGHVQAFAPSEQVSTEHSRSLTRHLVAAVAALAWVAARVAYFRAYSTGDPGRRHRPSGISFLVLMFMIGSTVYLGAGMAGLVPY